MRLFVAPPQGVRNLLSLRNFASDLIGLSLEALSRYKLRTLLAVTGIVIGVGAVTVMVSVIEGARREIISQVELLGLNNVVLRPHDVEQSSGSSDGVAGISFEDVDRLRVLVPFVVASSPLLERFANVRGPLKSVVSSVLGVAPDFQRLMRLTPAEGRLLALLDLDRDRRVCVLGFSLSRILYGETGPTGKTVTVEGEPYTVVGVLDRRDSPGTSGGTLSPRDLNSAVLLPARQGTFLGRVSSVDELWLQMPDGISVAEGGAIAAHALRQLHRGRKDFELLVPLELLQQRLRAQRTFGIVLGSVAALALLIGGIGIMNMMLASVLERTSEIGLRRSVGATRRWIMFQFLAESTMMTATGGVVGVLVGICASAGVTRYAGWPTYVSVWAAGAAVVVSGVIGIFFGTYPAQRAASLEPVDAVRYE